ncbi:hypothetical protein P8C59_007886 [Phyllachora maydis]|uniref:Protein phosphatase n=1 Tax=Phyllachora maydis TaxID=1825666 RepID=A0AAD9IAD4_9PEZI|nr:hypothetical protein P8C59_007886 [Phyllachora maydis]
MRRLPCSSPLASTPTQTPIRQALSQLQSLTAWQRCAPRSPTVTQHQTFLTALKPLFSRPQPAAPPPPLPPPHSPPPAAPFFSSCSAAAARAHARTHSDANTVSFAPSEADEAAAALPRLPFRFDTGVALFAKRAPRPFPPPFLSPPSGSFSDPLSTHHRSRIEQGGDGGRHRGLFVDGELVRGWSNGDDAVFASEYFICANDGVGAWSTRPRGHAGLWARLLSHCWATAIFEDAMIQGDAFRPDPVAYMQKAYEKTLGATQAPNDWQGTTTATGALLHYRSASETDLAEAQQQEQAGAESSSAVPGKTSSTPLLYVTNLGDSQVMVVRPTTRELVFKSAEQWHWFDCPRQLGTNSPDTPQANATLDAVAIREGDVVLAMTDGVIDNLWAHEIVEKVSESVAKWRDGAVVAQPGWHCGRATGDGMDGADANGMAFVAHELMEAAKAVALDPFAESPFMERAIEEGLPSEGGKLDDISVVAALCLRNE